jgi:hypothetical protein
MNYSMTSPPLWTWKPIPPDEDNQLPCAKKSEILANGFKIVAARARGKKHKHEGNYCEDWFEIARSGNWGIIAVADGAGSKRFSKIGARMACQAAVNYLVKLLQTHQIVSREKWSTDTFARHKNGQFYEQDIELTQKRLHEALQAAYHAIETAYYARTSKKTVRQTSVSDFATTLLLAVHTTVKYKTALYSLILACQVGDGMSAAIYKQNQPFSCVLGKVEKEGFCGETEFLTSSTRKLERDYLSAKTFAFFSPMQALMVMTDGVSDDYYPPDKGMLQLFGDLVLNGIIPVATSETLSADKIKALKQQKNAYVIVEERITEKGRHPTPICSVSEYAKIINLSIEELITAPGLLAAGIPPEIKNSDSTPENKLLTWLDTYNIRGSFDDRTLVVLFGTGVQTLVWQDSKL